MGVDAAFYLALPPFIGTFMFFSRSLTRKGKVKALGISLLSVVAISCLWRLAATYSLGRLAHVTANVLIVHVRTPLGMATAFALGCLIALLVEVKPRARFTQTTYGIIMFFGILIGFAEMGLRSDSGNTRSLYGVLQLTLTDPIAALSAALILYGLVQGGSPNTSRLAGSVPIAWFASLAYAVYLFHFPILEAISSKLFHRSAGIRTFAGLCLTMVIIVLPLAYFANRFIEQPFLEMKNRLRSSQSDSVRVDIGAAS
jgi:peptidoglycan/LPS O-acetylase OafA/YrhL